MKRWLFVTAVFFVALTLTGQSPLLTNVPNRNAISLDGKWHYIIDPYENGFYDYRRQAFENREEPGSDAYFSNARPRSKGERIEYSFDRSPTLLVPGSWNTQAEELRWYEGTIWYQRNFTYNQPVGRRTFLYFGAANYEAHVYVNGKKAGKHTGGFTPFNVEVTDLLQAGDNFVVVKVDNTRRPEAVPTVNTDWWNHGGLTRGVRLIEVPAIFIRDYKVQLAGGNASRIAGFVQLDGAVRPRDVTIEIPEAGLVETVRADESGRADFSFPVTDLVRWAPENPKLYEVRIRSGEDTVSDEIGFRTIEVSGRDLLLNGEKIFLRGICMHEENPMTGRRNYSRADAELMFNWAEELGANFVRLAHYPHNEYMVRLADERGILLWEEVPVYWTIQWENETTLANAQNQLEELITRDKNRASVIIWSVANETPVSDARNRFLQKMVAAARRLDDTRLISAAMEVQGEKDGTKVISDPLGAYTDLVSFNQYHGWYGGNIEDFPNLQWEVKYEKPVIVSEWGAGAQYGFHADAETIWSEEFQVHLYEKTLEGIDNIPGLAGFTPWILADFRSPRRPLPVVQDMWNRKGLIGEGGHKKMAFEVLRRYYQGLMDKD